MWANINHLLRYKNDYNPFLLDIKTIEDKQGEGRIKIPGYSMLNKLVGDFTMLRIIRFR